MNLWKEACRLIPGGVNSPVRAFGGVGGEPIFMERAEGPFLYDVNGRKYIDLVLSFGPMILGHNPPEVIEALRKQLEKGLTFGAVTSGEVSLAELILSSIPSMDMIRLVNSGTEATMSAVRLARGFTGRDKILKFRGCYHGHGDSFLIMAGSGALTHGKPSSLGVTSGVARDTLIAEYNHIEEVEAIFKQFGDEVAAVIVEPVAGNMGVVPPAKSFLEGLKNLCAHYGALLIFDEVMTGFRLAKGSAIELFGITPDIVTLGKVIGGGLPLAAYASRREIMETVSPLGGVYQAGTLSGNPIAVAAGRAQLECLYKQSPWDDLNKKGEKLAQSFRRAAENAGVSVCVNQVGSMLTIFFSEEKIVDTASALKSSSQNFAKFFHAMLSRGVYLPPSQFEAMFLSSAHCDEVLDQVASAAEESFFSMKEEACK